MINNKIYSLGGGCWVYDDLPEKYKIDTVFKSFTVTNEKLFMPLELFNGNLEKEFLHKDDNWEIIEPYQYDVRQIEEKKKNNPAYISNYVLLFDFKNKNNGWVVRHPFQWKLNPLNKYAYKDGFRNFNENKYNLFYIIDFHRCGYQNYVNSQLIEFENYIEKYNFNLNNFIYLDVTTAKIKNRFTNCRIPVFIQDLLNGKEYTIGLDKSFHNTRCFLENHIDYVEQQLERISKE